MKIHIKTITAAIFIPTPHKKPKNAPHADFTDALKSPDVLINSPIKAPKNGPKIIPGGPTKNPIISPIVEPVVAALLPPLLLVM